MTTAKRPATPSSEAREPASSPCSLHEADAAYSGIDAAGRLVAPATAPASLTAWRKAERERLIAARLALTQSERDAHAALIAQALDALVAASSDAIVSVYWPFRGEPDLRPWMASTSDRGIGVALPVVIGKGQPLQFRLWTPHARLERGVWNIPFPADGAMVVPTIVIAPLVGYDPAGYRLGYGGGFFDRTLAALAPRPLAIGVGHPIGALASIHPQWHDIPMDWIVSGHAPPVRRPTGPN